MTTPLTIYGFGLRGNSATGSIRKHRFRTKKHQKVNKSSQKTMLYLFGNWRPWVRVPPLRPLRNHSNNKSLGGSFFFSRRTRTKVLRRLENIVAAYRLRKSAALPSPYFLRARRHKQLSTIYASLTCHFDQKTAENEPFLTCFRLFLCFFHKNDDFGVTTCLP